MKAKNHAGVNGSKKRHANHANSMLRIIINRAIS